MKFFSDLWRALGISRPEPVPIRPPRPLNRLELHVTHACNLTCDSCCHYSNHGHRGNLDPALADRWMAAWRDRVAVAEFNLLGGEPTIHPRLPEFVTLVRRHWPAAHIRIITNGFFLDRHPDLPATLAAAGNAEIALSVHHDEPGYLEPTLVPRSIGSKPGSAITGSRLTFGSHISSERRYRGFGSTMLPFEDGHARQSWEIFQPATASSCMRAKSGSAPPWPISACRRPSTR